MRKHSSFLVPFLFTLALAAPAAAALKEGDAAPALEAIDDRGKVFRSADLKGKKKLVVFFYPGDMTKGCTNQAGAYRDVLSRLWALETVVVGISGDSDENHRLFRRMHDLNYILISDPEGKIATQFGVPFGEGGEVACRVGGKEQTLKRAGTAKRRTFVIDEQGTILDAAEDVDAAEDGNRVLELLRSRQ